MPGDPGRSGPRSGASGVIPPSPPAGHPIGGRGGATVPAAVVARPGAEVPVSPGRCAASSSCPRCFFAVDPASLG